ncbi:transcriptional regulator [Sinomonas cellulolyticus]|uniref:AAA family ATPase n=1 Tax=Sinomonas cellulolyticus TaxID=2801916 RepID=A0ABS1JZM5_9MICC|nr:MULTISPECIES: AAA family ATPase [Sinomonas]MBL0704648.1 AAA family ATPase [Sinomonas cellulolyticus]GHG46175.1 transcriptional regulator [Sinomonas sp. KCTC 49339]
MSRFAVITADTDFEHRVRLAAAALPGSLQYFQANFLPASIEDVFDQLVGEPIEVLVLGPDLRSEDVFTFAAAVDARHPHVSVIYAAQPTPELALSAMRSGVRDIVIPAADAEALRSHLEQAASAAASRLAVAPVPSTLDAESGGSHGRIIAVMSPKGGVGKTTIATNIAVGLGKIAPMSVVIVDLDLQFGDVASGLMLNPERTIVDAVGGPMDSLSLKTYLSAHPTNIYALCAPRNPADADRISPDQVAELVKHLAVEFQYVVIDTSPGLGEHVLATLDQATDVVWVCGMDIPSVRGLKSGLEILNELHMLPEHRHVVLNMADKRAGISVQDVEATLGVPVDIVLPRSRSLPLSTNRGVPALQDGLRDPAVKGLRKLVERFKPQWDSREHKQLHRRAVFQ